MRLKTHSVSNQNKVLRVAGQLQRYFGSEPNLYGGYPQGPYSQKWVNLAPPPQVGGAYRFLCFEKVADGRYKENFFAIHYFSKI